MSAGTSSIQERPPSQPRDQLVLQVEHVALSGRLLTIEIFEVQNAANSRNSTPSTPLRSTPLPSTPLTPSRTAGFRVAARDDVENEYSLFVTRQKAEYLYRAAYPVEAAATEVISLEAMANGILGHLNIIGNRQRDVGKLVCREPEPHVEKKTRLQPVSTPPDKQRNPHLPSKRQDQRAVRVQKTSKRTMEAVAKAMRRHDQDASGDDESAGSEAESGKLDRKGSEASILHRMAVADSKTMWKAELETNYEESEHASPLLEEDKDASAYKIQAYTLAPGLSPVKRALPERKTKHKDLEERRQKGRQQRIRATQAAQEALSSSQEQHSYDAVIEETEHDISGEGSRRSSMVTVSSTEKATQQPRASSAPRSSVVVGNAYALKNLPDDTSEPEQFLRRRPSEVHRSVLRKDHWQDDIGMSIEITAERPSLQTPPTRLDALLGTARRVMMVNSVGTSMQRSTGNLRLSFEHSRTATSPVLSLHALGSSHSSPTLQSPKLASPISDKLLTSEVVVCAVTKKQLVGADAAVEAHETATIDSSSRPSSSSTSTDAYGQSKLGVISPNTDEIEKSMSEPILLVEEALGQIDEDAPGRNPSAPLIQEQNRVESQGSLKQRSNSMESEGTVRLAPLPNAEKSPVQDFLPPTDPVVDKANMAPESESAQEKAIVPVADPEVVVFSTNDSTTEAREETMDGERVGCPDELPLAAVPIFQDIRNEIQTSASTSLPFVGADTTTSGECESIFPDQSAEALPTISQEEFLYPSAIPQEYWEQPRASDENIEGLSDHKATPEENTSEGTDDEERQNLIGAVLSSVTDPLPDKEVQGQNHLQDLNYEVENSDDQAVKLCKQQEGIENTDLSVQPRHDHNMDISNSASNNDLCRNTVAGNDAVQSESHDMIVNSDLALPDSVFVKSVAESGDPESPLETVGVEMKLESNEEPFGLVLEESETCAVVQTLSSGMETEVAGSDSNNQTASVCVNNTELDPMGDLSVNSGPSNDIIWPALGGEECADSIDDRGDEMTSLQDHDRNNPKQSLDVQVERITSYGEQLQPVAESETKCPDLAAVEINSATKMAVPESPPSSENPMATERKKSLSPGKKALSTSPTDKAKPISKVSKRRVTVAQVPKEPVIAEPAPKLERRHTAEDVKRRNRARRMSTIETSDALPGLTTASVAKAVVKSPAEKSSGPVLRLHNKLQAPSKRHLSQHSGVVQGVTNYHKKWGKWLAGRNIIEKVGCLQLEDLVMADPRNEDNLLKLGLRYARWSGTSLPAILLLEHAALLHKNATSTQEYWFWLGSAHLDIFMRHRKYLPTARFHLSKSIRAFTSAFAYIGSLADPMLLLRYAIGLFWHKGDGNLEKTRDIFLELFLQFVSFCDKDRPNLVFVQFQVFHRLKLYVEAIECMNKIIALHESVLHQPSPVEVPVLTSTNVMAHFAIYNAADYRLMLMQCQQASGDYVAAAQSLASVLKLKGIQQDTTLRDEQYFDLWYSLAEKCFHHEDYALALEYYAIALNFAKQSQVLAAIHYNLGLCFQSLGEDNKCVTEYKRARTANRHVPPLVSLTELSAPYDERFSQLLQKTVVQTIEEVRVELYGRAVRRLQRVFRQSRRNLNINVDSSSSDSPQTKMPSLSKRKLSIAAARNLPTLVNIEDTAEEAGARDEENVTSNPVTSDGNQSGKSEESALEAGERCHESFLARKQAAMEVMVELLTHPQYRGREASPSSRPNARLKVGAQMRSGLLSPEKDRLDVRRKQSMETFRQLGYVSSTMPWIEFWEKLLALAPDLFESRQALYGNIARIRGCLPLVTDDVAFCALAESTGNVHEAVEKLYDPAYERELTYVCAVIEVSKQLVRDFPQGSPLKPTNIFLPSISSPRADGATHNFTGATASNRIVLPPYSPSRAASASTTISNSKQHLRMNQMLNLHFQEHVQQQEAAIAIAEATGSFGHPQRRMEKLAVLKDFRKANDVLLKSQLAFGSEKAAT